MKKTHRNIPLDGLNRRYMVFKHEDKYYGVSYSRGLTELQDEQPFEFADDEIECEELERYEKVVTAWRPVKS